MSTWYEIRRSGTKITPVEVVKETAQFLFFGERGGNRREAKVGLYTRYFPSYQEAHDYLVNRLECDKRSYESHIADIDAALKELKQ